MVNSIAFGIIFHYYPVLCIKVHFHSSCRSEGVYFLPISMGKQKTTIAVRIQVWWQQMCAGNGAPPAHMRYVLA